MTGIKLCGFQTVEDVRLVSGLPIESIGFVMVPGRRRTVSLDHLPEMLSAVPAGIKKVAVLKDASFADAVTWQTRYSFDVLQLHGTESPAYCETLKKMVGIRLCKVFDASARPVSEAGLPDYAPWIDCILLDSAQGGSGKSFDWTGIPQWQEAAKAYGLPVWVAGGLHPDNVGALIRRYGPDGVDVSSGIETNGRKDGLLINRFVERVMASGDEEERGGGTEGVLEIR
ncbi:hypothetical protein ADL26_19940 [Thermoactinomyces vulgaris]|jgi:phosphoribosylanthranilate isomerase|nr:hypothetical protein ADL26_19940 [Thermoactinomyces vulgaris]